MPPLPNILLHAVPAFVLLITVEIVYALKTHHVKYALPDTVTSISLGLGNLLIGLLTKGTILLVYVWLYQHRLFTLPVSYAALWVLCFFADDFSYYWFHRIAHGVRWFWASHAVHHSSELYNLAAALRQTWTGNLTGAFLFWCWMPLVGFEPAMIMFMQSVSLIYQFWVHTEGIHTLPKWFEWIFNTPSHHRVHHGSDIEYLDKNHAGVLIIWDRLFGTFQPEMFTPTYGLTKNVHTYNPVKVAFHEWIRLWNDIRKSKTIGHIFNYLFNAPGWSHDGSSKTTKALRKELHQSE